MIPTSNQSFGSGGDVFGDLATVVKPTTAGA